MGTQPCVNAQGSVLPSENPLGVSYQDLPVQNYLVLVVAV